MKKSLYILFFLIISGSIFADESVVSSIRTYNLYDDLKYLQTIEMFIFTDTGQLSKKIDYRISFNSEILISRTYKYLYDERNLLVETQISSPDGENRKQLNLYNQENLLKRSHWIVNDELSIFSVENYIYKNQLLVEYQKYPKRKVYLYNSAEQVLSEITYESGKQKYKRVNTYQWGQLIREEVFDISQGNNNLREYFIYEYEDDELSIKTQYSLFEEDFIWEMYEVYSYNLNGKISSVLWDYNTSIFDPIYYETGEPEYQRITEFEYRVLKN